MKIIFLSVLLLFMLVSVGQSELILTAYNPTNNHYYQRYQFPTGSFLTGYNATQFCSDLPVVNGTQAYLVTWTTNEEWLWAHSVGIVTIEASWMSGTDTPSGRDGVWFYSSGPERGQPLYNLYFDKCYTSCQFGPVEPNLIPNEHYLHTSGTKLDPYWNNNNNLAAIPAVICEYGGMEEPIMAPVSTAGGEMTVTNLGGYQLSTLTITFSKVGESTTFTCGGIQIINSTAVTCQMPAQTGKYTVVVKDGTNKVSKTFNYQFESPFVSSVYPGYTQGSLLTITGTNFGSDASKLVVTVGSLLTPCNSINFLVTSQAFTCILSASLSVNNKLLPIIMTVDTLSVRAYKPAVYYAANRMFYSGFISSSTFQVTIANYSSQLRVDGQPGHAAVINSQGLYEFLNNTLPFPFGSAVWLAWQGATFNPATGGYTYMSGPTNGQTVPGGIYTLQTPDTSTWTASSQLLYNLWNGTLAISAGAGSTLVEYGGDTPQFSANTTNMVGTQGGNVSMSMDNYGTQFSSIVITFRGATVPYFRDFIQSYLIANVPIGIDGPYEITVSIDGRATPTKTQYIQYSPPNVATVNKIPTTGGFITIQGTSFYNLVSALTLGGNSCGVLSYVTAHTIVRCQMPAGSGIYPSTLKVGAQVSNSFNVMYETPVVSTVTQNISPLGGSITISGSNFFNDATRIQVTVGGVVCSNVNIVTAHTSISCTMPAGQGTSYAVVVTVSGQVSNNNVLFSYAVPTITNVRQIQDYIEIDGNNYGSNLALVNVVIGSITITSSCTLQSNTLIQCKNLATTVVSGVVSITGPYPTAPTFTFTFTPYLTSITPTVIPTNGNTIITINGRYFEQTSNGVSNTISVSDNGVASSSSPPQYVSNQRLLYTSQSGTGVQKTLTVSVGSRASNALQYSYGAPTLSATQSGLNMRLTGTNFGSQLGLVSVNIGELDMTQIAYSTPHSVLDIVLPTNVQNGLVTLTVDGQTASITNFKFQPTILSVQSPPVLGGQYNITGYLMATTNQAGQSTSPAFTVNSQAVSCAVIGESTNTSPYTYQCQMPAGSGKVPAIMTIDGTSSPAFTFAYQSPTVLTASSTYYQTPGLVTITGTNFANTNLVVSIQSANCPINQFVNDTFLVVSYDSSVVPQGSLNVSVTVNGLNGWRQAFTYFGLSITSAEQIGETVEIHGNASSVTGCTGNDTFIQCATLPASATSGYISVKNGPLFDRVMLLFRPILTSITPVSIQTSGDQITFQGRFFEDFNPSTGSMEPIQVLVDGNALSSVTLVNAQSLILDVPAGYGSDHIVQVSSLSLLSENTFKFTYNNPQIVSVVRLDASDYNSLTISGSDFSDNAQVVQATIGGESLVLVSVTHTEIIVTVPDSARNGLVQVTVSGLVSNEIQYALQPVLLAVTPTTKLLTSGAKVTVTGYFLSSTDSLDQPLQLIINQNYTVVGENRSIVFSYLSPSINSPYSLELSIPIGHDSFEVSAYYPSTNLQSNSILVQYHEPIVTSATPVQKNVGGDVTIYGQSFGDGDNLTVTIDTVECTDAKLLDATVVSPQKIVCHFDASVDTPLNQTLNVTVTAHSLVGTGAVFLYTKELTCPNNCSLHGICQPLTGKCLCDAGYLSSPDCSTKDDGNVKPVDPNVDPNGNTTFPAKVNFTIAISHLREINLLDNSILKTLSTKNLVWNVSTVSDSQKLYTGRFPTDPAVILVTITNFKDAGSIVFAGETIPIEPNSVKYEVTITDWEWVQALSTLEIIYNTKTDKKSTFNCEEKDTALTSTQDSESLYSFQLDTGSSVLNARFSTRMIVDSRIVPSKVLLLDANDELYGKVNTTEKEYNLLVAMQSPHFTESTVLDPTFSSLLKSETKTECGSTSNWRIPVIVVCSVVGGALVFLSAFLVQRKLRHKTLNSIQMSKKRYVD
ncbi:IPT/TIG domain-containing protein [Cavenderia fasciculata]|uniref:IPT/TIG domain-containing protein n=1 Tax=Cavenderia fasciculata TaxID=261658 RepID=F4PUS9_CACFS|nr:IPT/TIG domain-containing protein [Cavenderia fasciculata]EGG21098.1 IPT/TIG domain-containing protein [Cavenderia fasciculata]|eukprot:XP_004358948.1 IPT/TIG domain-containing protein [Cavenderia fasciculata]